MEKTKLDSIDEAVDSLRKGNIIIVVDDEDRENEGDFVVSAEYASPEVVTFMCKVGKGLICAAMSAEICDALALPQMVENPTALKGTAFTVSVDLIGRGCTTGISSHDRSATLQALANPQTKPSELGRPGHIFPIRAVEGGVFERPGHTEASVELCLLAGLKPVAAIVEIVNDDGSMARLDDLLEIASKFKLKIISVQSLINFKRGLA